MKCFLSPNETARDFWTNKDKILFLLHQIKQEEILRLLNIYSYLPKKFRLGGDRDQILSLQIAKKKKKIGHSVFVVANFDTVYTWVS